MDKLTALQNELTPSEKASLAFNHLAQMDEIELENLTASVPLVSYKMRSLEYCQKIEGLKMKAVILGREYFRANILKYTSSEMLQNVQNGLIKEDKQKYIDAQENAPRRVLSVLRKVEELAKAEGVKLESLILIADIFETVDDFHLIKRIFENMTGGETDRELDSILQSLLDF